MSDTDKKPTQDKGDEVLKRMLKTPPDPKTGKAPKERGPDEPKARQTD